ncbi:MAG TPA: efflux transporter outer membrane subunit [Alphaproteobacteria bacterium]|nr:efflux transporter outer membrane subunit [Alphaproteobacteria bacterium]
MSARLLARMAPLRGASALALALAAALSLAGCEVGPDYHRPSAPVPAAFKEAKGWKLAEPQLAASKGPWWSVYDDPVLDRLEREVDVSNQTLKQAEAAYREATAIAREAGAELYPTVGVTGSAQRAQSGGTSRSASTGASVQPRVANTFALEGAGSWDLDLWGRIRRTIESNVASAEASAADVAAARLSAQASLATDYFDLRAADQLQRLLDDTVVAYQRTLDIVKNQYEAGTAARSDVASAETQLETTRAEAINVGVQRALYEHAIAVLVGKPAADFGLPATGLPTAVPVMPAGVPSTLLERRPDIAAAERAMASANALIGVAEAAYYPDISLSAAFGYSTPAVGQLFNAANQLWSLGTSATETLFDAGERSAAVDAARAVYDQSVASYRQTVLTSFQQVEDELATLRILERQAKVEAVAVRAAEEAVRLALNEYRAGTVAYTTVITAQTAALADEQTALTIRQNRLLASVALIEALGGGWEASQLPNREAIESDNPPALVPATAKSEPSQPAPAAPEKPGFFQRLFGG